MMARPIFKACLTRAGPPTGPAHHFARAKPVSAAAIALCYGRFFTTALEASAIAK